MFSLPVLQKCIANCFAEIPEGQIESNYDEVVDSFDNMNLKAELLRGVYAYGFERPSAIQARAIMPVIKGKAIFSGVENSADTKNQAQT